MMFFEFKLLGQAEKNRYLASAQERIGELDRQREESSQVAQSGGWNEDMQAANPWPKWVRKLIKVWAKENDGTAEYDRDNRVYKVKIPCDSDDSDDLYEEFKEAYEEARKGDPNHLQWSVDNHITASITEDDERECLKELEAYLTPRSEPSRKDAREGLEEGESEIVEGAISGDAE